ncbi:unnamed protein product [Leptidea sinapis]|uniref:Kazal-like domain-containing protein n=1 Tax=Leptidea sinapis TaxID=189913 RepID=A0A5E4PR99_9NEOP|nr:unnamed protein product [Leptidea sinapis]
MASPSTAVLLLALVCLGTASAASSGAPGLKCFCPGVYKPVCGSDGLVYSNAKCMFCANSTLTVVKHGTCTPTYYNINDY